MKFRALMALCLLFPAGCMSRTYVDPTSGPVVSMEFLNKSAGHISTAVYEDDYDCYDIRYVSFFGDLNRFSDIGNSPRTAWKIRCV